MGEIQSIPLVMTVQEAAELLRCEPSVVERYIAGHKLAAIQIGRERRIRGEDLIDFVDGQPMNRRR